MSLNIVNLATRFALIYVGFLAVEWIFEYPSIDHVTLAVAAAFCAIVSEKLAQHRKAIEKANRECDEELRQNHLSQQRWEQKQKDLRRRYPQHYDPE